MNTRANLPRDPNPDDRPADPVDHTDIDPNDGSSYGRGIGPEDAPREPSDPPAERPPTIDRDDALASIYASRSTELKNEREGLDDETRREAEIIESFAAGEDQDPAQSAKVRAMVAEAQGNPLEDAEPTPPAQSGQPARPTPEVRPGEGLPADFKFKLSVYGEERELGVDEATQLLQQEIAAGTRMRNAADQEQTLRNYSRELEAFRDRVLAFAREVGYNEGGRKPAPSTATEAPPDEGAPPTISADKLREITRKILSGDEETATEALLQFATDVQQGRASSGPTPPLGDLAREVARINREEQTAEEKRQAREAQRTEANKMFRTEFADVVNHDAAWADAQAYLRAQLADPANAEKPYVEIARKVGKHMRAAYELEPASPPPADPAPPTDGGQPAGDELARRRDVKRTLPHRPAASQAAPTSTPAKPPPDNSDYVRRLRIERGLPV